MIENSKCLVKSIAQSIRFSLFFLFRNFKEYSGDDYVTKLFLFKYVKNFLLTKRNEIGEIKIAVVLIVIVA